jgi:hypothetical protein
MLASTLARTADGGCPHMCDLVLLWEADQQRRFPTLYFSFPFTTMMEAAGIS